MDIYINARRWFQKTYGNTYFSLVVYADGKEIDRVPYQYGYGDYYRQEAGDILEKAGFMPNREHYNHGGREDLRHYCQKHGIDFLEDVQDVPRKKDLHKAAPKEAHA